MRKRLPVCNTGEVAERPGTRFVCLEVHNLQGGEEASIFSGEHEIVVLPLSVPALDVKVGGKSYELEGRRSVFDRVTDFAYVPCGSTVEIRAPEGGGGGDVALAGAPTRTRVEPDVVRARDVPIEVRGAGPATRQVTNYLTPGSSTASKLCVVEVHTPEGNTSSYPPHKHDEASASEAVLEEIYYFEVRRGGFGLHRCYTADGAVDDCLPVRSGDVYLLPRGYHGPCVALPGYDLYYLNVLGGPGSMRSMGFSDDPAHHWVRDSWSSQMRDARCPMVTHSGSSARLLA